MRSNEDDGDTEADGLADGPTETVNVPLSVPINVGNEKIDAPLPKQRLPFEPDLPNLRTKSEPKNFIIAPNTGPYNTEGPDDASLRTADDE